MTPGQRAVVGAVVGCWRTEQTIAKQVTLAKVRPQVVGALAAGWVERRRSSPSGRSAYEYRATSAGEAVLGAPSGCPVIADVIDSLRVLGCCSTGDIAEHTGRDPDLVRRALARAGVKPAGRLNTGELVWRGP